MTQAVFAIPGDKDQRTGGYIYDASVLRQLNESGCRTAHLELPGTFPSPPPADMATAVDALSSVPDGCPIIVDGLALGAMAPDAIASVRAPVIAMVHHPLGLETGLTPDNADALLRNEAEVLKHAAHVIVPSPHIAETLSARLGVVTKRITVATPGFDRPTGPCHPDTPPLILSVGLLAPRKGHDVLIDALALVADLPWRAQILGRRQDEAFARALEAKVAKASLSERITLTGEVNADRLQDAYRRASIFALATRYEGYGMVLSEAMLHQLPVVSCDVGAVPGTVGDAGCLVPPDDPVAFAQTLRTLLEDPDKAAHASNAARAKAADLPTWADTARQFATVIAQVTP